jgi:hypothetical protein
MRQVNTMHIAHCDVNIIPSKTHGALCKLFVERMRAIYAAYCDTLPGDYWEQQGKYQYIELAHTLLQQPHNLQQLHNSQHLIFIYMSPELHSSVHLGPALQQHYDLKNQCYDIIDCHYHALAYALKLSNHKIAQQQQTAIICLEHRIKKTFQATSCHTTQNSASILCLSHTPASKMPHHYQVAGIYAGKSIRHITQQQGHLLRLKTIAVITNQTDTEYLFVNQSAIIQTYLCLSAGFSNIFFYLQQCLTQRTHANQHILIALKDPHEQHYALIWIKPCS